MSLEIETDAVFLGKDVVLTCTVHGIENIDKKTTRQWSMGIDDELLCYNGRINNRGKYKENVLAANVFSLTIINVTHVDLKVLYKCRYGFDAASIFIEEDESISHCTYWVSHCLIIKLRFVDVLEYVSHVQMTIAKF